MSLSDVRHPDSPNHNKCESSQTFGSKTSSSIDWLSILRAILGRYKTPTFLMQHDLTIRLLNNAVLGCSACREIRIEENQKLSFPRPFLNGKLVKTLEELNDHDQDDRIRFFQYHNHQCEVRTWAISRLSDIIQFTDASQSSTQFYFLSLKSQDHLPIILSTRLATAFNLTPAEANLAAALANGLTLKSYAEREDISLTTARWHLKNIYSRMDIKKQSDLIRRAIAFFI